MKTTILTAVLFYCLAASSVWAEEQEDKTLVLNLPPASLQQWYRPANKHDVWLHTMFRLRREMQAVTEYAALEKPELLRKWLLRLQKDYQSIGKMVPEWADELETGLIEKMLASAGKEEWPDLARYQRRLGKSCQSCHREYKLAAALRYRAPDFSEVMVESEETLDEEHYSQVMKRLSLLLNRVKIAAEDQRQRAAATALDALQQRLQDLGTSCVACHDSAQTRQIILGDASQMALQQVRKGVEQQDSKQVGRYLGEFAVEVCADCHGIHRMQGTLRQMLSAE